MGGRNYCSVPGCQFRRDRIQVQDRAHITLFSVPKDREMLEEWSKVIRKPGKELTVKEKVCELHFTEDNIDRFYETVLTDGTVWRMKKSKNKLKKGAIPTIFPDLKDPQKKKCSSNTETTQNEREISSNENPDCKKTKNECTDDSDKPEFKVECKQKNILYRMTQMTLAYDTLVSNLELVTKPNSLWSVVVQEEFVVCAKWDEDGTLMKRVIIDCSLKIQVFFKDRPVDFDNLKISYIKDLCSILKEIDSCGICINVDNLETAGCDGYILPDSQSNLCDYCLLIKNLEVSRRKDFYWLSKARNFTKHQTLYEKIHILSRRNVQLKEQLNKIVNIKAVWKLSQQAHQNLRKGLST